MTNCRNYLVALCMAGMAPIAAQAQQAVQFPGGDACWTVTVQYHPRADASPAAPTSQAAPPGTPNHPGGAHPGQGAAPTQSAAADVQKIQVTQSGNLCQSVVTYTDGVTTEVWWLKDPPWVMYDRKSPPGVGVMTSPMFMASFKPDATMFSWVDIHSFINKTSYRSKDCDYYAKNFPPTFAPPGSNPPPVVHQAWVDADTGVPMAVDDGIALYVFTFNPPPKTPLTLPARFTAEIARVQSEIPKPVYLGNSH